MAVPHFFGIKGLDPEGEAIIEARRPVVSAFIAQHLTVADSADETPDDNQPQYLRSAFLELEERIARTRSPGKPDRDIGRDTWCRSYLSPLAESLSLTATARRTIALKCLSRGYFDVQNGKRLDRPEIDAVLPRLEAVVAGTGNVEVKAKALMETGLCREQSRAKTVAEEFMFPRIMEAQCAIARGIILSTIDYHEIGLLISASYVHAETLLRLEAHHQLIVDLAEEPEAVLAMLRSDLIVLRWAFDEVSEQRIAEMRRREEQSRSGRLRLKVGQPRSFEGEHLWRDFLLHDRPGSPGRTRYQKEMLRPWSRQLLQECIARRRGCDGEEAARLLRLLLDQGIPGLVDWRCRTLSSTVQGTLEDLRIQRVLDQHLAGLNPASRRTIKRNITEIRSIFRSVGINISIFRLLDEYPNNEYRRHRKRDLGLGGQKALTEQALQAINLFSASTGYSEGIAHTLTTDLVSYGGIGLLPHEEREEAISPEAHDVLYFFKLARQKDTAPWPRILSRVNQSLAAQGRPALSSQVARAIYDQLRKPGRWHFGSGDNVDHRARIHWQFDDTPRIHRAWHIVVLKFALDLVDESGRLLSDTCHILLVLDDDSELPLGIWPSATPPGEVELGLATYQAIWHPGFSRWQLRGVPGTLFVPESLAGGGLSDLQRGADLMLLPVQTYSDERVWRKKVLAEKVHDQGAEHARGSSPRGKIPLRRVYERLMRWLKHECFPNHRPDLLAGGVSGTGVGMPGFSWAGAGWLLPAEPVTTIRNGVAFRGLVYSSPTLRSEPGLSLAVRRFPYRYSKTDPGVFVERDGELYFLSTNGERVIV